MNWFMILIGVLGGAALKRVAGHFLQQPKAPLQSLPAPLPPTPPVMLESFENMLCRRGISIRAARALVAAGLDSFAALKGASDETLLAIKGVGPETVKRIRSFSTSESFLEGELI